MHSLKPSPECDLQTRKPIKTEIEYVESSSYTAGLICWFTKMLNYHTDLLIQRGSNGAIGVQVWVRIELHNNLHISLIDRQLTSFFKSIMIKLIT